MWYQGASVVEPRGERPSVGAFFRKLGVFAIDSRLEPISFRARSSNVALTILTYFSTRKFAFGFGVSGDIAWWRPSAIERRPCGRGFGVGTHRSVSTSAI